MKFAVIFFVVALIISANGNFISRKCECKAVSDTIHFPFHSWDISSCKFCLCNDPAMTNCESSCRAMVENYAKTGCGKVTKGSKIKYSFEASNCAKGLSTSEYICA